MQVGDNYATKEHKRKVVYNSNLGAKKSLVDGSGFL
jgi:hypothetical protein